MLKTQQEREKQNEQRFNNIIISVGKQMMERAKEGHDHAFIDLQSIHFDDGTGSPIRYALNSMEASKLFEYLASKGYQMSIEKMNIRRVSW